MPQVNRLSAVKIAKTNEPGRYPDGGGLYLRVAEYEVKAGTARSKNWVFRFERHGRERQMGLGSLETLSLADARTKARECRMALLEGRDPIEARQAVRTQERATVARAMTFQACAQAYIRTHQAGWKNPKHAAQWPSTLATYVYPVFGGVAVGDVDAAMVVKCLEPIWTSKPDTAIRVRGRIEKVLDWAAAYKHRTGDNPARWRGHLDKLLPSQSKTKRVRHHPALPWSELPTLMAELRARDDVSSRALEFTILTAGRTNEVIGARLPEIDFKGKLWTIPGERMKGGRPHIVPLSDRAVAILEALPQEAGSDFLFAGARQGRPLSDMAMLELLRGLRPGFTVHGFRSTFRDWAGDRTNFPREVIEAALAHVIEDETEAAYRRGTAVEKRRRLMAEWGKFCGMIPAGAGKNVVSIGGGAGR